MIPATRMDYVGSHDRFGGSSLADFLLGFCYVRDKYSKHVTAEKKKLYSCEYVVSFDVAVYGQV